MRRTCEDSYTFTQGEDALDILQTLPGRTAKTRTHAFTLEQGLIHRHDTSRCRIGQAREIVHMDTFENMMVKTKHRVCLLTRT